MVTYKVEDYWQFIKFFKDEEYLSKVKARAEKVKVDLHSRMLSIKFNFKSNREWTSELGGNRFDIGLGLYTRRGNLYGWYYFKDSEIIYRDFLGQADSMWCIFKFNRLERYGIY